MLNHLFNLNMAFSLRDLSENNTAETGTRATVSFNKNKIRKALKRLAILDNQNKSVLHFSDNNRTHETD